MKPGEQALYECGKAFQALRAVDFLLFQCEGEGHAEWMGQPLRDIQALLSLIADHGLKVADEGYEKVTAPTMKTA